MTRRADRPQPALIERYLQGIQYPASKKEIIRFAQEQEAPGEVMHVLEEIPNRDSSDAVDFAKGVGRVEPGD